MEFVEGLTATPTVSGTLLQRLADTLGYPVAAFSDATSGHLNQTSELLRLWSGIERGEDRAKVLAVIEAMVTGSQPK